MLTEIFLTFLVTTSAGLILKLASMCYKSKCSSIDLCCLKIIRNTELEQKEDELEFNKTKTPESPIRRMPSTESKEQVF